MTEIFGTTDPAFIKVREAFEANFSDDSTFQEVGAAVSVYANGRQVVDLWGGTADQESGRAFDADTLVHVFSTSKGLPAIAIAQMFDQGQLNYHDPVAKYWPEFAQAGKEGITIAHIMSHQSGVNAFEEPIGMDEFGDWEAVVARLAAQAPAWTPGKETSYHAVTYGHLAMEVVRRITGLLPRDYVQQHIAGPVGADVHVGVEEGDWPRVASLVPPPPPPGRPDMNPIAVKALMNPMIVPPMTAMPPWRLAQIPAVNAHVSARGLAKIWNAIAQTGNDDTTQLLSPKAVSAMVEPLSTRPDLLMGPLNWGAGVLLNNSEGLLGPDSGTVGSIGFGGSFAMANVELGVAAGYTPNRLFPNLLQDPRAMPLRAAIIESAQQA
jgi:CubicO group peptidase (beta-lactamase class C family)